MPKPEERISGRALVGRSSFRHGSSRPLLLPLDFPILADAPRPPPGSPPIPSQMTLAHTHHPLHQEGGVGGASASEWQVVLYQNRNIVVWDNANAQIQIRKLSPKEVSVLRTQSRFANCPMCGQNVNLDQFSFEAATYFKVLEEAARVFHQRHNEFVKRPRSSSGACWAAPNTPGPMLEVNKLRRRRTSERNRPAEEPSSPIGNPYFSEARTSSDMMDSDMMDLKDIPPQLLVNQYYDKFFIQDRKLGSGAYGQVYLCRHKLDDLILGQYAVKKIPVGDNKQWLTRMLKEVKVREHLHHQNIVSYKHSWLEMASANPMCPRVPWLFVLMEYCDGGDLEDLVQAVYAKGQHLSESEIWSIFIDIVEGLQHLHHAGILHRDLKPQNILLRCDTETLGVRRNVKLARAVLADFGTCEALADTPIRSGFGFTGTVEYTAPELLVSDEAGKFLADYDFKSDMWSTGLLLHYLAYGCLPFDTDDDPGVMRGTLMTFAKQLAHEPLSPSRLPLHTSGLHRSLDLRQCIVALLSPVAEWRPSCDELLRTPLVRRLKEDLSYFMEPRMSLAARLGS